MHEYDDAAASLAARMAELSIDRLQMQAPLDRTLSPAELEELAGQTVTPGGIGGEAAAQLWEDVLAPACLSIDHPRYLAFIPGAPSKAAAAFDMLIGASSIYGGSWLEASGAVYAENQALRWIADLAGLPESAGGVFVQGGTNGNLSALVAARAAALHARGGTRPARWAVMLTHETHSSVKHALESVMDVDVVEIPGDDRGRLTGSAIRSWLEIATDEQRHSVFAVVATAGTTNLGVIDDLAGIGEVAREQGWWFHVDGAYGGAGLAAPSVRALFDGIEQADSFIVDPHKWLFSPFDACALLYRDPVLARAAHTQKASYLDVLTDDPTRSVWNPSDYAIHLTRRPRGLPLWFSLAVNGTDAYRDAIETTLAVTRAARELIDAADHVNLLVDPDLSVLIFERVGWSDADYNAWSDRLLKDEIAFVTPTKHRGRVCTRFAIVNPRTTVADLQLVLDSMRD
ncbi:pyridoxal phosphate-dependent decarboxylase family protein [Nocardioides sp. Kera G14]|uniref:pyridoxal phosphate-dependent decarboxylase family protein n=1 Tax=Nocardioides sp. Kera G14 TaxID=2884264 RepID=UPI001D106E82|nr:aminotransferase class V-fold PLP-dependent enzyme [Nocardioides sp. Kera G14]UDY25091.1 aminotransferase class V-fold PLP-dependent enzyme [Nocardioides sp. Kera G14]